MTFKEFQRIVRANARPPRDNRGELMTEPETRFTEHLPRRNVRGIALLVGLTLAIVAVAAVTMGASPSAAPLTPGASAAPGASGNPDGTPGRPWKGDGHGNFDGLGLGRFGGDHLGFGGITITGISGSNLTLKTVDGWTRTIAVTSATTITKGGQTINAGQLSVGDSIRFRQTRGTDGSFTITAIEVIQPSVAGTVTGVTADTITLTARDGTTQAVTTTGSTTYHLGGAAASRSDVVVGSKILATGSKGAGTSFTATSVRIKAPRAAGTVTAKSATTITIQRKDGTTQTIKVDSATTYQVAGVTSAKLSDVAVGMRLEAVGRQNTDGSLDATAIRAGNGKIRGGPKNHDDFDEPGPSASPDSSSNSG
jgi:hypothetical protein